MSITRLDTAASAAASTLAFSVSAGSDRLLVVVVTLEDNSAAVVDSIDYGGQAMVLVRTEIANPGGIAALVTVWYLLESGIAAASGTTITPSFSSTPDNVSIHAASYAGALQTSGVVVEHKGDLTTASTPNPLTTVDLNESSGHLILAAGITGEVATASWQSDLTEQTDEAETSSAGSMADRLSTTEGNVTIEVTWTDQNRAAIISVHFAQVGFVQSCLRETSATSDAFSESASYEVIPGMTLTPGGGDYLAWFTSSFNATTSLPESIFIALFVNGVIVSHTEREIHFDSSMGSQTFLFGGTHALVQPTDGQVVDVRWKISDSATCMAVLGRTLNLIKLDAADIDEVTATGDDTTTSTSFTAMDSMQITPGAGKFALFFTCSAEGSGADDDVNLAVFVDGVIVQHTKRSWIQEGSINPSSFCYAIAAEVNPTAGQVVEIKWLVGGGTGTVHERTLTLWKTDQIQEASATSEDTTTSTSFELLDSMTLTPDEDEYLAIFSGYWEGSTPNDHDLDCIIVEGGTEIPHTLRISGSDGSTPNMHHVVSSNGIVSVDGTETVQVHFRRSVGGTLSVDERTLVLISCAALIEKVASDTIDLEVNEDAGQVAAGITASDLLDLEINEDLALLLGLIEPQDNLDLDLGEDALIDGTRIAQDTLDVALDEVSEVNVPIGVIDLLDLEINEGPAQVVVGLTDEDLLDLEVLEDTAQVAVILVALENLDLSIEEGVSALLGFMSPQDLWDLAILEGDPSIFVEGTAQDDLDLEINEATAVLLGLIEVLENVDLEILEDPAQVDQIGVILKVASDLLDLEINEATSQVAAGITDEDTLSLEVNEDTANLLGLIQPEDTAGVSVDELTEILARAERLDTLDLDLTEAAELLALLTRSDTLDLEILEDAGQIAVGITAEDDLDLEILEGIGQVVVGIQANDTLNLVLIEATTLLGFIDRSDSLDIGIVEGVPLVFVRVAVDDILDLALDPEVSDLVILVQVDIDAADTLDLAIVEGVGQVTVAIQAADLLDLSVSEVAQVVGFLNRTDILDLDLGEQADVAVFIQAADQLDIEILDVSGLVIALQAADNLDIDLVEFSQVFNALSVIDTLDLNLTEDALLQAITLDFEGIITKVITLDTLKNCPIRLDVLKNCPIRLEVTREVRFTLEIDPGVQRP